MRFPDSAGYWHPGLFVTLVLMLAVVSSAQTDPGPRAGAGGAGGPVEGLNAQELNLYWAARDRFKEVASVSGGIQKGIGLGPTFNGNSCAACHAQPAAGGSSAGPASPQVRQAVVRENRVVLVPLANPQIALATLDRLPGREQKVPPFLREDGPVRVARRIRNPDGTLDGGVQNIYTIGGRTDAPDCALPQPDFAAELAAGNLAFRIPTPTFGAGLIEAVPDTALLANLEATARKRRPVGIAGRFNRSANDGTIARFGWKAQNKSLLMFAAESYNVEEGVTNDIFPNERDHTPGCLLNPLPEDTTKLQLPPGVTYEPSGFASDVVNFAAFIRLSAPPEPAPLSQSAESGSELFGAIGCALCHSPTLTTGSSPFSGMSHRQIHPYSDFALHHMGPGLADHVLQGLATGDEFRTAPLWGVGQRLYFLHDGRTSNLLIAIESHSSTVENCRANAASAAFKEACNSEANGVIEVFNSLSQAQKQDILNFLRTL